MKRLTLLALLSSLVAICACGTESLSPIDEIGALGGGGTAAEGVGGGGDDPADALYNRLNLSGEVTWAVTFDDVAKAGGATDCSYTRRYRGSEDASRPWQCPTCDGRFRAEVEVVEGLDDCYAQVTSRAPQPVEWLGYGGGPWWRGAGALMSVQGTATLSGNELHIENDVADIEAPEGGTLGFHVTGTLSLASEMGDPLHGFRPPATYSCGWPKAAPEAYDGDYLLTVGAQLPDGVFKDACDEAVRLHDFAGSYLFVDMSAVDCPPCRQMAALEERFVSDMAAEGIDVHVVTLLAPSLDDTLGETTKEILEAWILSFELSSPVLADRGWGLSQFVPAIGDDAGYPSWVLVDPGLTVLEVGTGFGGWGQIGQLIRNDLATID